MQANKSQDLLLAKIWRPRRGCGSVPVRRPLAQEPERADDSAAVQRQEEHSFPVPRQPAQVPQKNSGLRGAPSYSQGGQPFPSMHTFN